MKNITVLQLAEKLMNAHNETCGETFMDIELHIEDESISFDILNHAIGTAFSICELLNLTLHVEANTDPQSFKSLNFYIT